MYKKVSVAVLLLLLAVPMAFASVDVLRVSTETTEENVPINVAITVMADTITAGFDLYEFAPSGWDIISWDIEGYSKTNVFYETKDQTYEGVDRTSGHWKFIKTFSGEITITYQVMPTEPGNYDFLTVWTYPGGFDRKETTISVIPSGIAARPVSTAPTATEQFITALPNVTVDVTIVVLTVILFGFSFAGIIIYFKSKQAFTAMIERRKIQRQETPSDQIAVEDLRAFIKLGLRRGYTLRQMAESLRGSNIDTHPFRDVAKEEMIKDMDRRVGERERELKKDDKYVRRLHGIISRFERKD